MPNLASRVRQLADAAAQLGHRELSVELHEVARLEEARDGEPDPLTDSILALLTALVHELARIRQQ